MSLSEKIAHGNFSNIQNFIRVKDVKEFIKKVENIITRRKSRREQLLELKECAGDDLLRGLGDE